MRHVLLAAVVLASYVATGQTGFAQSPVAKIIGALDSQNKNTRFQAAAALGNYGKGASTAAPALKALADRREWEQAEKWIAVALEREPLSAPASMSPASRPVPSRRAGSPPSRPRP
jgi:hypothetical protein